MITGMTEPTPEDAGRKTQIVPLGSKTIVVREMTDLQMMHMARYARILQRDDVDTADKVDASNLMLEILHFCVASDADREILVTAERKGEVTLSDLVSFVKSPEAQAEPEDAKPAVRRTRVPARRK
jgi:hypothetical protein